MRRKEGETDVTLYNMLPFLEGWMEQIFFKSETVEKGKYKVVFSENFVGWLTAWDFVSNDAYASLKATYLGNVGILTPHGLFYVGAITPPPYGSYLSEYIRPSTLSTAGVFAMSVYTLAYPMSIKGLVRIEFGLEAGSTQSTATAATLFTAIRITDTKAFIKSFRKFKYGWLGWAFGVLSHIPGLKYIGIPDEIKEVLD